MSLRASTKRTRLTNRAGTGRRGSSVTVDEVPDPQVPERAQRRTFTVKYKLAILDEYDAPIARKGVRSCGGRTCIRRC
ncbi:conserved hypothetical protein [Mycobacterium tuberculosis EAS054]|nr:conserved hypothetical protein [Mycobacterium tuberculosis EAS054]